MADEIDIQSFDELFDKVRQGTITQEQFNSSLRALSRNTKSAAQGMMNVGRSLQSFAGGLARGSTSVGSLSGIVSAVGKGLELLNTKSIPGVDAALGALTDGFVLALEQFDNALGTFYNLGQIGALGADGIDDVRKQMVRMGVPLDQFNRMVAKNTKALVGLTGSASETAENFSGMMGYMRQGLDMELRYLGFTTDEVGETLSNYANIQRRLGAEQNLSQGRLTAGAVKFGKEMDLLAKVTGTSREQQQSSLDAAMREGRFLAAQRQLEASGAGAAAQELNKFMLVINDISPTLGSAIKDTAGGFISTQAAQQGFISTGGALPNIIAGLKSGQLDYATAIQQMQNATKQQLPAMESINLAVGDATGAFVPLNESVNLTTFAMGNLNTALEKAQTLQDQQITPELGSVNQELVNAAKNLEEAASNLQATAISFDTLSGGVDNFVELVNDVSKGVYQTVGTIGDTDNLIDANKDLESSIRQLDGTIQSYMDGTANPLDPWTTQDLAVPLEKTKQYQQNRQQNIRNAISNLQPTFGNMLGGGRSVDIDLMKYNIVPTEKVDPAYVGAIEDLKSKYKGDVDNEKFLNELKKLYDMMLGNTQSMIDSNNKVNKNLETIVAQNNTANDQRDKQVKYAANA